MDPQPLRLLLVEDDLGDVALARRGLGELPGHAFQVEVVNSLADALRSVGQSAYDAIILDLNLPDSAGIDTLRQLNAARRAPIVVLTGNTDHMLRERALALGAQDFIGKHDPASRLLSRSVLHILDQARAEASHRRFETLIAALPDAVIVVDDLGRVVFVNQAAIELFAMPREELLGLMLEFSVTPGEVSEIQILRGGGHRTAEIRLAEVDWEGERADLVSIRDITERRLVEERLRRAQKIEAVAQLTGGVAHDFNNLLHVIISSAQMLPSAGLPAPARQHADLILRAGERAAELTHRLLAFARQQPLQPVPVDVNQLISDITTLVERVLGGNIELEMRLQPNLPPARTDAAQLEAAIVNLSANARDAMPNGGRLSIETRAVTIDRGASNRLDDLEPGRYVQIAVSDDGSGMSADVARRAFDPFFTTKEPGKGTGLGLSMVYGLMRQLGGHTRLSSEPGRGTTVTLCLPTAPSAPAHDAGSRERTIRHGAGQHIMVVEDDELVRAAVEAQLRSLGYRVTAVPDGPAALDRLAAGVPVDLLFTDLILPRMDGPDLVDAARRHRPALKVLFTSGSGDRAAAIMDKVGGAADLLSKPYRLYDLANRVSAMLDGPAG